MSKLLAVVEAGERGTHAVLAGEALRKAAGAVGQALAVEIHTPQGVLNPIDLAQLDAADGVFLVGEKARDDPRFARLTCLRIGIDEILTDAPAVLARMAAQARNARTSGTLKIVAITSCPTGIAHTFMAAEGLQQGAKVLGHDLRVETQGSVGARDGLSDAEIAAADLVVIAADTQVDLSRFAGKRIFLSPTKPAITNGALLIERALAEATVRGAPTPSSPASVQTKPVQAGSYKHLMTGVSFMLPFVVAGGLLIAIAFALGGIYAYDEAHKGTLAYALFQIGAKGAFVLMVPALAGYIAYSIADRPGIAPGMIGGLVAANLGAGFLGGIAAGFIAGYAVAYLNKYIRLHRNLEGLKPVLVLPLLGTLINGLLMLYVVGAPAAQILAALTAWLKGMQGSSAIVLGLLVGAMMAFDMGGPVNKAAYAFATGLIASQVYTPMAAVMVAGMTPPLGLALAARLFSSRFAREEREAGNAAAVLGLAFVTEGAIPFAARDPIRVIPALIAGSAVAGAISMAIGAELKVPHGGVFVLPIPNAVTHLGGYIVALIVGTLVTTLALRILKRPITSD